MGGAAQEDVERGGEGLWVRHPTAPRIGKHFGDERATLAVLAFLRDTKVGEFVSLAALGGGAGGEEGEPAGEEGEEEGSPPPQNVHFLCLSLGTFLLFWGAREQEIRQPHCDGRAPHGLAAGWRIAGRGRDMDLFLLSVVKPAVALIQWCW